MIATLPMGPLHWVLLGTLPWGDKVMIATLPLGTLCWVLKGSLLWGISSQLMAAYLCGSKRGVCRTNSTVQKLFLQTIYWCEGNSVPEERPKFGLLYRQILHKGPRWCQYLMYPMAIFDVPVQGFLLQMKHLILQKSMTTFHHDKNVHAFRFQLTADHGGCF